jgi:hypothetical protein
VSHVVTVWWRRGGEQRMDDFPAVHVRSQPLRRGWQIELCDDDWKVFGVEQFEEVDRVSIRRTDG